MQIAHQTYSLQQSTPLQGTETVPSTKDEEQSQSAFRPDKVTLSKEGQALADEKKQKDQSSEELTQEEQLEIDELLKRDTEVRTHEQAHIAASGGLSQGAPSFSTTTGPDGQSYATEGSVNIDMSAGRTPEETIAKMRTVQKAALAPANPSSADRQVAASAAIKQREAQQEISDEQAELINTGLEAKQSSDQTVSTEQEDIEIQEQADSMDSFSRLAIENYGVFSPDQTSLSVTA